MTVPADWHEVQDTLTAAAARVGISASVVRSVLAELRALGVAPPADVRETTNGPVLEWRIEERRTELTFDRRHAVDLCAWHGASITALGSVAPGSVGTAYARFLPAPLAPTPGGAP